MRRMKFHILHVLAFLVIFVLIIGCTNPNANFKVSTNPIVEQSPPPSLPTVGTLENLKKLVSDAEAFNQMYRGGIMKAEGSMDDRAAKTSSNFESNGNTGSIDYSKTNVQVDGVDESDLVKTDGEYIYKVNGRSIVIAKAYPAEQMQVESTITFDDNSFYPGEIYVDGDYLVVLGQSYREIKYEPAENKEYGPYYYGMDKTNILIYDIKDRNKPIKIREAEIEGYLLSSRKIGSRLYIVSNKYINYYLLEQGIGDTTPVYKDSLISDEYKKIGFDCIKYFPDAVCDNYMIIGAMDIDGGKMTVDTYLGAGQNIYVSTDNLYAAVTKFEPVKPAEPSDGIMARDIIYPMGSQNTLVYKFSLKDGAVSYAAKGEVPGSILNQFSMDEHNGYFRIATTSGNPWRADSNISKNNLYILDDKLNVSGKIEDIAPGERIYSVRFMGDRGYMVTFRTVDPLFVMDLKDPKKPKILGALKIPGYSNYLHPYDENHIIGFGKDTVEIPVKDDNGNVIGTNAFYLGMKMAIFDITDVNNPVELFAEKIGDRGTESELLYNHKALLFSKEKNLLAFPVTLFELSEDQNTFNNQYGFPEYGTFKYQGAYIYNISLEKGFTLKGRISHMSDDEYKKSGMEYYGLNNVERILYIDNALYTISGKMIKASEISSLQEIKSIQIPRVNE